MVALAVESGLDGGKIARQVGTKLLEVDPHPNWWNLSQVLSRFEINGNSARVIAALSVEQRNSRLNYSLKEKPSFAFGDLPVFFPELMRLEKVSLVERSDSLLEAFFDFRGHRKDNRG
jgi:hypothetical protein